jgi:putative DNA primase/helicase
MREFVNVDRRPDVESRERACRIYERLAHASADDLGAVVADDGDAIPYVRYTADAQEFADAWRVELELRTRSGVEPPVIEAHSVKYRSLLPSLALISQLADHGRGPVGLAAAQRAAAWCALLEGHMRRVYASATMGDMASARMLLGRLRAGDITGPFRLRDLYRRGWSGLDSEELSAAACARLEEYGWVRAETVLPGPAGGRPSEVVHVHPSIGQ